jgi:hypothetical protein
MRFLKAVCLPKQNTVVNIYYYITVISIFQPFAAIKIKAAATKSSSRGHKAELLLCKQSDNAERPAEFTSAGLKSKY